MDYAYLGAFIAIFAYGTYMVPLRRFPRFPSYASLSALSVGILAMAAGIVFFSQKFSFGIEAFVCGVVWTIGGSLCFAAVQKEADLSGTSVRAMSVCILSSFLSGILVFSEKVNFGIASAAVGCLILGFVLLSPQKISFLKNWRSIGAGFVFGTHLIPYQLSGLSETEFAFPYACGIFLAANIRFVYCLNKERVLKRRLQESGLLESESIQSEVSPSAVAHSGVAPWIVGIGAGAFWMCGTMGCFWAIDTNGSLGYAVGYPLTQLNLLVNIAWGVLIFKEYPTKKERIRLGISALIILGGAALLTISKT